MTQQSEKNKLIAGRKAIYVFMHPERTEVLNFNNWWFEEVCPAYDKDWNALMPVVEKINSNGKFKVVMESGGNGTNTINSCSITKIEWVEFGKKEETKICGKSDYKISLIEVVYQAVIQFITYYNSINKTTRPNERPPARPPV